MPMRLQAFLQVKVYHGHSVAAFSDLLVHIIMIVARGALAALGLRPMAPVLVDLQRQLDAASHHLSMGLSAISAAVAEASNLVSILQPTELSNQMSC